MVRWSAELATVGPWSAGLWSAADGLLSWRVSGRGPLVCGLLLMVCQSGDCRTVVCRSPTHTAHDGVGVAAAVYPGMPPIPALTGNRTGIAVTEASGRRRV